MRVSSFVPTATEWMYAIGIEDRLVSVTSECDVPERAKREKPWAIRSAFEGKGKDRDKGDGQRADTAAEIDARVRSGAPLYRVDAEVLRQAQPDVILTQSLCDVCAASHAQVAEAKRALGYAPKLVEVSPSRLDDVPEDARAVARAAGAPGAGDALANDIHRRLIAVRRALAGRSRPRVVALEWTDPPMSAGHWIPDMLEAAGLHDPLSTAGGKSARISWSDVHAARPHALLVMPCAFDLARSVREAQRVAREFPHTEVYAFDASRYFARSGPSVATAVEVLAHALHPRIFPDDPDALAWRRVT